MGGVLHALALQTGTPEVLGACTATQKDKDR